MSEPPEMALTVWYTGEAGATRSRMEREDESSRKVSKTLFPITPCIAGNGGVGSSVIKLKPEASHLWKVGEGKSGRVNKSEALQAS
jgi:hypothetical protein